MKPLAILMMSLLLPAAASGGDEALQLARSIPLENVQGRIDHLAISADGKRLAVAALENDSLDVIDLESNATKRITGITEPQGVCFIPQSNNLAVTGGGDGNVRIYDAHLALVGTIDKLDDADNIRFDPQTRLLYSGFDGGIAVIDPQRRAKVGEFKLDGHPESFQLERNGNRIFVNVPQGQHVAVVDRVKQMVTAKWSIDAAANFPMALDEAHQRLFVGCRKPASLNVLDTSTGRQIASLDCVGDADDIFVDRAASCIYVIGGEGFVSIFQQIDADHYRKLGSVRTSAGARTGLFDPQSRQLFVAVPHRDQQSAEILVFQARN